MLPSTALVASALTLLATAPAPAEAAFDLRALGHHAHAALTQLSHLPEVVGFRQASGVISTTETTSAKRSLWARYYGDSRGFSRPKPLIERRGTIPTGWTEIGCVTEGTTSRTLNGLSYIDSGLTPEKCMTTCLARGFSLAGVEWSDECYCGQSFQGGGGAPGWSCDVPCKGDNSEMCGGYYFLNAYQYTAAPEQACNPTTAETPTPASSAAVSGASSAAASGASSAMAAASSGFTSIRASASAGASGIASASAAGPSASATAPGVTTEWEYQGCYWDNPADNNGLHLLQGTALTGQTNMTPELCQDRCAAQGYNFAGLEYGQECYCGDVSASDLASFKSNEPWCTQKCTGDASVSCGGGWSMAIYEQVDVSDEC